MKRRAFPTGLPVTTWWQVDASGEVVDMLFDGAPYATPEAIGTFPPPALDAPRCDACVAVSSLPSWEAARAHGWRCETWYPSSPGGTATFCPTCAGDLDHSEPEPW